MTLKNLLILCGGNSLEHSVSIMSAKNIFKATDLSKFNPILVGLDKLNDFYLLNNLDNLSYQSTIDSISIQDKQKITFQKQNSKVVICPLDENNEIFAPKNWPNKQEATKNYSVDVVFPCIHGAVGEDGLIQGFLEIMGLPYVGNKILGSTLTLDKIVAKTILKSHGIKVANYIPFHTKSPPIFDECVSSFALPFFAKIADSGSSLGVFKIKNETDFNSALKELALLGSRALFEEAIIGQEVECAVIGSTKNADIRVAPIIGEIKPNLNHEFYSYQAKYLDPAGAKIIIPAKILETTRQEICKLGEKIFSLMNCEGLARIDFFVRKDSLGAEEIIFNEVNTMPGFTDISMFPLIWQRSGKSYSDLITELVELA